MHFLFLTSSICFYLSNQLLVMIPAAETNEAASKTANFVQCLPYKFPSLHEEIKFLLKKNIIQDNRLTLWNMYVLDRSLIVTSLGSLLSYGVLIGTLGTES
ncbi:uncharacterized protein NPIL_536471 [Nephila pilipes]|uniref:Gustatory receptor n=1 Tax=Nephila pilipes TaxID=299642 RepID=A0A8X6NP68_NEPPI|nr:uncharacterized protein NPIL_536471 [Nephila pilipes]